MFLIIHVQRIFSVVFFSKIKTVYSWSNPARKHFNSDKNVYQNQLHRKKNPPPEKKTKKNKQNCLQKKNRVPDGVKWQMVLALSITTTQYCQRVLIMHYSKTNVIPYHDRLLSWIKLKKLYFNIEYIQIWHLGQKNSTDYK